MRAKNVIITASASGWLAALSSAVLLWPGLCAWLYSCQELRHLPVSSPIEIEINEITDTFALRNGKFPIAKKCFGMTPSDYISFTTCCFREHRPNPYPYYSWSYNSASSFKQIELTFSFGVTFPVDQLNKKTTTSMSGLPHKAQIVGPNFTQATITYIAKIPKLCGYDFLCIVYEKCLVTPTSS